MTVVKWLTGIHGSRIRDTKVFSEEIVWELNVYKILRNNEVALDNLKELVDDDCFKFLFI